jgi:hypothetical protein
MFGLMGFLDIRLNPANMITLPFILGIGLENGVNIVHDFRRQGPRYRRMSSATSVAVMINSLTTMVGFGALMIANHRGLQSLGRVLTLAMGCCLLCSLLLPNLLVLGQFGQDAEASDDWDEDYDEDLYDEDGEDDLPETEGELDDADDRPAEQREFEDEGAWPEDEASIAA